MIPGPAGTPSTVTRRWMTPPSSPPPSAATATHGALIYDRYADRLHDHCWSILRDEHEAGDALHDAFVKAARALPQLRDPSRLRPWLYAIARNEAFRRHRARARAVPTEDLGDGRGRRAGDGDRRPRRGVWRAGRRPAQPGVGRRRRPLGRRPGAARPAPPPGPRGRGPRRGDGHHGQQRLREAVAAPRHAGAVPRRPARRPHRAGRVPGAGRDPRRLGRRAHAAAPQAGRPPHRRVRHLRRAEADDGVAARPVRRACRCCRRRAAPRERILDDAVAASSAAPPPPPVGPAAPDHRPPVVAGRPPAVAGGRGAGGWAAPPPSSSPCSWP